MITSLMSQVWTRLTWADPSNANFCKVLTLTLIIIIILTLGYFCLARQYFNRIGMKMFLTWLVCSLNQTLLITLELVDSNTVHFAQISTGLIYPNTWNKMKYFGLRVGFAIFNLQAALKITSLKQQLYSQVTPGLEMIIALKQVFGNPQTCYLLQWSVVYKWVTWLVCVLTLSFHGYFGDILTALKQMIYFVMDVEMGKMNFFLSSAWYSGCYIM